MNVMHTLRAGGRKRLALLGGAAVLAAGVLAGTGSTSAAAVAPQALPSGCSGSSPITCHYGVSPGNYDVTVSIGSAASAGQTAMWVEARRLMLPTTSTAPGAITTYSFTINVRQPEGQPTGEGGTGTPGLDIRFTGSAPQVSAVTVKPASSPLVAYLAGDSTVCDQPTAPYTGWGQILPASFGPGAAIANYADSGESSGSFLANSALYPAIVGRLKAGDLVFIQFGHNDKTTTASDYRSHLTTMVNEARAKGGIPVLVTPPVRHLFSGSQLTSTALHVNSLGVNLPAEMRAVATALNVPLIDLTAKSAALVTSLGPTASAALYLRSSVDGVTDNTHFSQYGATQMAGLVVQGVQEKNLTLVPYLRTTGSTGGNTVTVSNPGSQSGTVGAPATALQIQATDSSAGASLTYSATGLPAGLSISPTGLISGTPATAGTSTVAVTAKDATGASGTASFIWTISGATTGEGTCSVSYAKNEWGGGFTANLTIANTGTSAVNGWTLTWSFPGDQKVTSAWNATVTQSGMSATATNVTYNGAIAPGATVQFGFQGTWTSDDTSPTAFALNGTTCTS